MSEALIASLNQRITALEGEKANLKAALKEARNETKTIKAEFEKLNAEANELLGEYEQLEQQANAAPDELQSRIAELQGQLATRDHRDAFRAKAKELGVKDKAVDDLYNLSGLKPGDGPVEPESFAEFLTAQKEVRGWAFEESQPQGNGASAGQGAGGSQGVRLTAVSPPPGAGRGVSDASSSKIRVSADQLADGLWMQANQEVVAKASAEGRLEIV